MSGSSIETKESKQESARAEALKPIFDATLQGLKMEANFKEKSPRIFLMYAHDNAAQKDAPADAKEAQKLIQWLHGDLEINLYSDRSPDGNETDAKNKHNRSDVLVNQLHILPKYELSADYVILCGSKLLRKYEEDYRKEGKYQEYQAKVNKIITTTNDNRNFDLLNSKLMMALPNSKDTSFHHVITELIFLEIRLIESGLRSSLIPLLLNGEKNTALPEFLDGSSIYISSTLWRKASNWQGQETFTDEGLYLGFFELLERIYGEDAYKKQKQAIHKWKKYFEEQMEVLHSGQVKAFASEPSMPSSSLISEPVSIAATSLSSATPTTLGSTREPLAESKREALDTKKSTDAKPDENKGTEHKQSDTRGDVTMITFGNASSYTRMTASQVGGNTQLTNIGPLSGLVEQVAVQEVLSALPQSTPLRQPQNLPQFTLSTHFLPPTLEQGEAGIHGSQIQGHVTVAKMGNTTSQSTIQNSRVGGNAQVINLNLTSEEAQIDAIRALFKKK